MEENKYNFVLPADDNNLPSVDVIVVNWNGLDHLPVCLSALLKQSYKKIKIFVVDNGSNDDSVKFINNNFPQITTFSLEENLGFCGGNNHAITNTESEFVALINNDTEADRNWITNAVNSLINNPEAGFIASRICFYSHRNIIDTCGDLFFSSGYPDKRGWLNEFSDEFNKPEWVFGACAGAAIYRRTMLDKIGVFDKDYFSFQEDVDLSFRAQLSGFKCFYEPSAIVYHKVGATAYQNKSLRTYWSHRNHWYTLIKNLPLGLFFRYSFQIIFAEILIFFSSIIQKNFKIFIKARIEVVLRFKELIKKRKTILSSRKVSNDYINSIIMKNWVNQRLENKRLEKIIFRNNQY